MSTTNINLLKRQSRCTLNRIRRSTIDNYNIIDIFKNDNGFHNDYKIIKTFYEKNKKAVYLAKSKVNGGKYIIKVRSSSISNKNELEVYNILKNNTNENTVKYVKFTDKGLYYYFVYEYFPGINLAEYLNKHGTRLSITDVIKIFSQIVKAVNFLHNNNIIHCDLKLENIIIDKDGYIKITDFDLSRICQNELLVDSLVGTLQYIAPESYDIQVYSKKSDIWCLGIIFHMLLTMDLPYESSVSVNIIDEAVCRRNQYKHPNLDKVKEKLDKSLLNTLKSMLSFEDYKRLSAEEILVNLKKD